MNALTVLRGLACLAIIIWHVEPPRNYLIINGFNFSFLTFPSGLTAVWVFFILSGYLMGKVFTQEKYILNFISILSFYFRRIVKIVPLYYFNILICSLFTYKRIIDLHPGTLIPLLTFTASNFLNLNGFNLPLWAISTEMQFYLFVPLIAVIVNFLSKKKVSFVLSLGLTLILGLFIRFWLFYNFASDHPFKYVTFIYTPLLSNLDYFLFGYLINQLISNNQKIYYLFNKITAILLLTSLYLLGNYFSSSFFLDYGRYKIPIVFFMPTVTCLIIGYFLVSFEKNKYHRKFSPPSLPKMINNTLKAPLAVFELVGTISLGMYLWHKPIIDMFHLVAGDNSTIQKAFGKASAAIVLSFLAGLISHLILSLSFSRFRSNRFPQNSSSPN